MNPPAGIKQPRNTLEEWELTPHFAIPPYRAELFYTKTGWSGVMNRHGINCCRIKGTGVTITSFNIATKLAEKFNQEDN